MKAPLVLASPAKLNLFLHITGRRGDGYHTLQTVFQLVDLCDTLRVTATADGAITLHCERADLAGDDNLAVRAARALQAHTGVTHGARIALEKRIPVGGGMGGGSSNAATTLLALNKLWGCGLALEELAQIGLRLGADVPLFVLGDSAFAEGIGEELMPVPLPARHFLIIAPGCAVNTAAIFNDPELTRNTPAKTIAALLTGISHNDCEAVVRKRYPEVDRALAWLARFGQARMSGTGSSVFADFPDAASALQAQAGVPTEWESFVARGLDRSPVHRRLYD